MEAEGVRFRTGAEVGRNVDPVELSRQYDAMLLCGGSTIPRDLPIEGRELQGIHFAMDFLEQNNRRVAGDAIPAEEWIAAKDKHVVVIGGGDTGSDCVGTANRHGARSVTQIELMPKPPSERDPLSWPNWPVVLRTSSSHEEGCERQWSLLTKAFVGEQGQVTGLRLVEVEWAKEEATGKYAFREVPGSEQEIPCDLALLAIGFVHPQFSGMLEQLGLEVDDRGNVRDDDYRTNAEKVFVAGDMRRGQSLVVWAIAEGREAARRVDAYLMGDSVLESRDTGKLTVSE
jgi:glutamate synthase (NADPH/NADH) small chain